MEAAEIEVIKALLDQNRQLTQQLVELAKEAMRSNVPAPYVESYPMTTANPYALHMPVSEEDARAAHAAGAIDDAELENQLKELAFFNSELVVPSL